MPYHRNPCEASTQLNVCRRALVFSIPILVACALLFLFYLLYLCCPGVDWESLQMRASIQHGSDPTSRAELGLKQELREMLPIVIYKESFTVNDTQCSVCLGDYKAEDRLQQIPACGHAFHMECIDLWLSTHTTCPLCRISLLAIPKYKDTYPSTDACVEPSTRSHDVICGALPALEEVSTTDS